MFKEELKAISIADLEKAIAKVVSELAGIEYSCNIGKIDHSNMNYSTLELSLSEHLPF